MTILLWGRNEDPVVNAVAKACNGYDLHVVVTDTDHIRSFGIECNLVTADGQHVELDMVTGVLVRPDGHTRTPEALAVFQTLDAWTELTTATVLNRPSAAATNRSKPYQLQIISRYGFAVPDTLVTTDPADIEELRGKWGRLIYKSVSGTRSIVAELSDAHCDRLDDVSTCPTQFQQHVPGTDYRVHVVDAEVFACSIESNATDYRYAAMFDASLVMAAETLPARIERQCVELAHGLGLGLAGIDLRLDPDGQWWCFEVNTAPGFTWFEDHTGLPIAAAVARALAHRE